MKLYSRHQGGWIARFVIIGVALLLALLLGVYFLRSQAKSPQAQVNQPASTKNDASKPSSPDNKSNIDQALPSGSGSASQSTDSTANSGTTQAPQSDSSSGVVGTLPHTGPETTAAQLVVVATLAFVATLYIRSRRVA